MQQTELFRESRTIKIGSSETPDLARVQWRQDAIKRGRKETQLPRLTAWYGNSGKNYVYSGIRMKPLPWNAPLLAIKQAVDVEAGTKFNSVLLNYYRMLTFRVIY